MKVFIARDNTRILKTQIKLCLFGKFGIPYSIFSCEKFGFRLLSLSKISFMTVKILFLIFNSPPLSKSINPKEMTNN